ncbi:hypothetical protein [Shinella lacus]|uniref:hypothetical protein n=1 Tax=Shinella lacus TaxID=2654216 RepID=UPI00210A4CFC|nr:hypothetical protein [Shinella lacus]
MNTEIERGSLGDSFEDFLKEQGTYEETTEHAIKRVLAYQLEQAMKEQNIGKARWRSGCTPVDRSSTGFLTPTIRG